MTSEAPRARRHRASRWRVLACVALACAVLASTVTVGVAEVNQKQRRERIQQKFRAGAARSGTYNNRIDPARRDELIQEQKKSENLLFGHKKSEKLLFGPAVGPKSEAPKSNEQGA